MRLSALSALADRPFRLLWLGKTTSGVGSAFTPVALAFAVLEIGGTATSLGLVLTAAAVTRLAFLLIGGVWADRLPRRAVMLTADLVRLLVQTGIAVVLLTGVAQVWQLAVAAVLTSVASAFFRPASIGLIAQTSAPDRRQQANALLSISDSTAQFAGPALSGVLVATAGAGWSFAIDAASFAGSAFFLALMPALGTVRTARQSFVSDLAEGWREVASRHWYWLNLIAHAIWNLAYASFFVLGPVIAARRLGGATGWGVISAGLSAGAIIGGFITLRARPRRPLVAANLALVLGALPLLALAGHLPLYAVVLAAVIALAGGAFLNGIWDTAIQSLMPEHVLARAESYDSLLSFVAMPVGYAIAGPVSAAIGAGVTLIIGAALMVVPSALAAFIPGVRAVARHPDGTITGPTPVPRTERSTA
jgi:MFS family permease